MFYRPLLTNPSPSVGSMSKQKSFFFFQLKGTELGLLARAGLQQTELLYIAHRIANRYSPNRTLILSTQTDHKYRPYIPVMPLLGIHPMKVILLYHKGYVRECSQLYCL